LDIGEVKIYDVLGVEVLNSVMSSLRKQESQRNNNVIPNQVENDSSSFRIDVSALSPGDYFVRIGDAIYKFVKF